jgi:hypothetical protein
VKVIIGVIMVGIIFSGILSSPNQGEQSEVGISLIDSEEMAEIDRVIIHFL